MLPQALAARTSCSLAAVMGLAFLTTACVSDDPLLTSVSPSGGGSSATDGAEGADTATTDPSTNGAGAETSTAACLVGSWDVDKPSYLSLFSAGGDGMPGSLTLDGVATMDFTETTLTSTYRDWTVTGESPDGQMTLEMNGVESSGWSVGEDDLLILDNPESTVVSTLTVSSGGQQMVLPAGDDAESVDLSNFRVACDEDRATFTGSEGFLVLQRK